jgi:hypothetical protein
MGNEPRAILCELQLTWIERRQFGLDIVPEGHQASSPGSFSQA